MELKEETRTFINVRTLDGKTDKIPVFPDWTVQRLKEEFGKYRGQDFSKINMHYKAKRLNDRALLSTYKIEPDGFVQANIRSLGGHLITLFLPHLLVC